jgi:hypothetical protein
MAYSIDASQALATHSLLLTHRLVSPIQAVTPLGFRQGSSSETSSCLAYHDCRAARLHFPYRPGRIPIPRHRPLADGSDDRHLGLAPAQYSPHTLDVEAGQPLCLSRAFVVPALIACAVPLGEGLGGAPAGEGEEDL